MPTITVSKNGGTITVASTSEPSNPTISYGNLPSYTSRSGNVITINLNASYDREFELSVTSTTRSDPSYQGTATASSAWTVSQAGDLGPAPNEKFVTIVFNCTNVADNARYPNVNIQVFGDDSGNGPQLFDAAGYKIDHSWPYVVSGTVDDSEYAEVVITLTDSLGGSYTYSYGMGEATIGGTTTVTGAGVEICDNSFSLDEYNNYFYLNLKNNSYN